VRKAADSRQNVSVLQQPMHPHLMLRSPTMSNRNTYDNYNQLQGVAKKGAPKSFSPFSQQQFGIFIWNFTALFTQTVYI